MDRPELPSPYYWREDSIINIKRKDGGTENVAWYWKPGEQSPLIRKYKCYSAPEGEHTNYYEALVDTEDEAVALIVSFALLGITKE